MKNLVLILIITLSSQYEVLGQLTVDFNSRSQACLGESLLFENNSSNYENATWDFCSGDLLTGSSSETSKRFTSLDRGAGFELVFHNDNWFGFVVSARNKKVFRLDFGSNLNSIPEISELDIDPDVFVVDPEDISMIHFNNAWYGVIAYGANGGDLIRLDFGISLESQPSVVNLGSYGISGRIRKVRLLEETGNLILAFSEYGTNKVWRINYRDSFDNLIQPEHVYTSTSFSELSFITGFDIQRVKGNYIGHAVSILNNQMIRLNFGNSILNEPTLEGVYVLEGLTFTYGLELIRDGVNFYAAVLSDRVALKMYNLGDLQTPSIPQELTFTEDLPVIQAGRFIKTQSKVRFQGVVGKDWFGLGFNHDCDSPNFSFSDIDNPIQVYSQPGEYFIDLEVSNSSGESDYLTKSITILPSTSPSLSISHTNFCTNNPTLFTSVAGGNPQSYTWDFGDGAVSTETNPQHTYTLAGTYPVQLSITDLNGCSQLALDTVRVFDEPQAQFNLPSAVPLCSNNALLYENTTVVNAEAPVEYSWDFHSEGSSTVTSPTFAFSTPGNKEVTLTASLPGCENSIQQSVALEEGARTQFLMDDLCLFEEANFTNESTGSGITGFNWDFGDGNGSIDTDPIHNYAAPGEYSVTLATTNDVGCVTTQTQSVMVHDLPIPAVDVGSSCDNEETRLTDISTVPNANITAWTWKNPTTQELLGSENQYSAVFPEGENTIRLIAESNFGCRDSLDRVFTTNLAPSASFTFDPLCVGTEAVFTSNSQASVGYSVVAAKNWFIDGLQADQTSAQTLSYDFPDYGSFDVELQIAATNNCRDTVIQTVEVSGVQDLQFANSTNCEEVEMQITNGSQVYNGQINAWTYSVNGLTATESEPLITIAQAGEYTPYYEITTDEGCVFTGLTTLLVEAAKPIELTASEIVALTGTTIDFTVGGDQFQEVEWDYGDGTAPVVTTGNQTQYAYGQIGDYSVQARTVSEAGCPNEDTALISIGDEIDLAIHQVQVEDGVIRISLENRGSMPVYEVEVSSAVNTDFRLAETIQTSLFPVGRGVSEQTVDLTFQLQDIEKLEFLCIDAQALIDFPDADLSNNRYCLSVTRQTLIAPPYPNPSSGEIHLDLYSETSKNWSIRIYDAQGGLVKDLGDKVSTLGFQQLSIPVGDLSYGVYILEVIGADQSRSFRIAIQP